jgi:hypothetical protein
MKRCSQCEFIYEDDQHLCDMDGHELVYEPTLALQITAPTKQTSGHPRRFALAAVLAIFLATLLSVGYSGFTREYAPQNTKAPSSNLQAPHFTPEQNLTPATPEQTQAPATPDESPTPSSSHNPRTEQARPKTTVASPIARNVPRITSSGQEPARSPAKTNHKKESTIGGFLKKTGKVLKRPFKF